MTLTGYTMRGPGKVGERASARSREQLDADSEKRPRFDAEDRGHDLEILAA
jgi:hypothetical protein